MMDLMVHETDVAIIGAGPVGLFAVFELGLLDLRCHLVDTLTRPGGQCAELYPEKPIYDIPGITVVTGQELTDRLLDQIKPFEPRFSLGQQVESLQRREDGRWELRTSMGERVLATVVVVAAGGGSFVPKKPPIAGLEAFEGRSVFYFVRQMSAWAGLDVLVAGGGDSALDWALALQPVVRRCTVVTSSVPARTPFASSWHWWRQAGRRSTSATSMASKAWMACCARSCSRTKLASVGDWPATCCCPSTG
jgi:thioredoxin reductase (NADPH)